jgi:hypothetical protein
MSIRKYRAIVIRNPNLSRAMDELNRMVNYLSHDGWEPVGGLSVSPPSQFDHGYVLGQAMGHTNDLA